MCKVGISFHEKVTHIPIDHFLMTVEDDSFDYWIMNLDDWMIFTMMR